MSTEKVITQEVEQIEAATERLRDFLRGYSRNEPEKLSEIGLHGDWQMAAFAELKERARAFMAIFDEEILRGIAQGDIVMTDVVKEVAAEMRKKPSI